MGEGEGDWRSARAHAAVAKDARRRAPEPVGERTGSVVFGQAKDGALSKEWQT